METKVVCILLGFLLLQVVINEAGVTRPAFSAGLTSMLDVQGAGLKDIVYDRVFLNSGNAYDSTTGIFTTPYNGTYIFLYHGLAEYSGELYIEMFKNDVYETSAYAHVQNQYAAASNAVVLKLVKDDKIHMKSRGTSKLYGDPLEVYTTFSGYLLFFTHGGE